MEKVYMELPKKNLRVWKNEDVSPYDFRDDHVNEPRNDQYSDYDDEYDMDAIMDELNRMEYEIEDECNPESDMYENGNIDWRCNEDISQNMKEMHIERKSVVEEENPKRKTTTWMRVKRVY